MPPWLQQVLLSGGTFAVLGSIAKGISLWPKTRSEARQNNVGTDLSVGDANIRHAREEADRAQKAREEAETARDTCKRSLNRALDAMDTVLDAMEQVMRRQREGTATADDWADLDATMDGARREVRELRP